MTLIKIIATSWLVALGLVLLYVTGVFFRIGVKLAIRRMKRRQKADFPSARWN